MKAKSKRSTRTSLGSQSIKNPPKIPYEDIIAEDPEFFIGSSKFRFPNGDEYNGEFCAHASGLVWRQGKGTYTTKDGQIYVGEWDGDKLDETQEVQITYPDGTQYLGLLLKNKYTGSGIYKLEEKVSLMGNFVENKPTGDIILIDPNEKSWHGFAEKDESLLVPEHAFYHCIGKDLGKGRTRTTLSQKKSDINSQKSDTSSVKGPRYCDIRNIETQVFAKTKKTPSNLQFETSEWYQEYEDYRNTYGEIVCKAKNAGEMSLRAEEYGWYIHYKEFEKKYTTLLNNFKNKIRKGPNPDNLFEIIHCQEYRLKNKPVSVLYPTEESGDTCDSSCEC